MNSLIYGLLEKNNNDSAVYFFGYKTDNMTGKVIFFKESSLKIVNFPQNPLQ